MVRALAFWAGVVYRIPLTLRVQGYDVDTDCRILLFEFRDVFNFDRKCYAVKIQSVFVLVVAVNIIEVAFGGI